MIAIADYGMGNLRSVSKAFEYINAVVCITNNPEKILAADALVVPGVGAFGDCIKNLNKLGLLDTIKQFIKSGKPYLGLCLGMQILFDKSEEAPDARGIGIFKGTVKKFPKDMGLKIPHMGWNQIKIKNQKLVRRSVGGGGSKIKNLLFEDLPNNSYMYFVHSFYVHPEDKSIVAAETDYGITFCSAICKDNIWATQFHPEKSQKMGLQILWNFSKLCK